VLHLYEAMMRRYFQEAERIPHGQVIDVRYDDLVHRPLDVMENLYAGLGADHFQQVRPRIEAYLEGLRGYQKNSFSPLTDEEAARIEARWGFAFARLGYDMRASPERAVVGAA
jgi:hypothetical protein